MVRTLAVLALLTGCGRVGFESAIAPDAPVIAPDAVPDARPDAPSADGLVVHFTFPDDVVQAHGARDEVSGVIAPCDVVGDYSCPLGSDDGPVRTAPRTSMAWSTACRCRTHPGSISAPC